MKYEEFMWYTRPRVDVEKFIKMATLICGEPRIWPHYCTQCILKFGAAWNGSSRSVGILLCTDRKCRQWIMPKDREPMAAMLRGMVKEAKGRKKKC